tara:strand:+ start:127 stop:315 length:189 start_codon:yes stop_codon:yes gene_type:complete
MERVLTMEIKDEKTSKNLIVEYAPSDNAITISIDGYDTLYSFVIDDVDTMRDVGDFILLASE